MKKVKVSLLTVLGLLSFLLISSSLYFVFTHPGPDQDGKTLDYKRINDLRALQNGLELYYQKSENYPDSLLALSSSTLSFSERLMVGITGHIYNYCVSTSHDRYVLQTVLQYGNVSTPPLSDGLDSPPFSGCQFACNKSVGEYCVSP